MSEVKRDRLVPGFDAGLIDASKHLFGGVFTRKTLALRNAIGKGYRKLDTNTSTLCFVTADNALYELISNPDTESTADTDWKRILNISSGLTPLGTWNINNADPEIFDTDAEDKNGNFYFITGAPSTTLVNIPGLFNDQSVNVKNGDLIVSNGEIWFVNPINVSWDTLDKPQVIIDYVNGEVIAHTHEIADINLLQDELDLKYDETDAAPLDEDFGTIPDIMLINLGFLKQYYRLATDTYSRDEVDDLLSALDDFYTSAEVDDLFDAWFVDVQTWVSTNYDTSATVDAKISAALDGVDGVIIGEATLIERNNLTGGDTVNGYVLTSGHRLIVTDGINRYVDKFIGDVGDIGALFWTRLYLYDIITSPTAISGLWIDCGLFDASIDEYPDPSSNSALGSGDAGAILKGNTFDVSVSSSEDGNGDIKFPVGALLRALIDNPGQLDANWKISYA